MPNESQTTTVPVKAPDWLKEISFDDDLFNLCRKDDYAGLYEKLIEMVSNHG